MTADSSDVLVGMRLLDTVRQHGFTFQRPAPGPDGPLRRVRDTDQGRDTIYFGGFSRDCMATRSRESPLLVPGVTYWSPTGCPGKRSTC